MARASNDNYLSGSNPERLRPGKCPICGAAKSQNYHPFCSKRCADVDLGRWLLGKYIVPGRRDEEEDEGAPSEFDQRQKDGEEL